MFLFCLSNGDVLVCEKNDTQEYGIGDVESNWHDYLFLRSISFVVAPPYKPATDIAY